MKRIGFWRALVFTCLFLIQSTSVLAATVKIINGVFTVIPKNGDSINITEMSVNTEGDKDILVFTTIAGLPGFIHRTNIKNVDEVLALVKCRGDMNKLPKMLEMEREVANLQGEIKRRERENAEELAKMQREYDNLTKKQAANPDQIIRSECQQKWGNNYRMIEFCIKEQTGARQRLGM